MDTYIYLYSTNIVQISAVSNCLPRESKNEINLVELKSKVFIFVDIFISKKFHPNFIEMTLQYLKSPILITKEINHIVYKIERHIYNLERPHCQFNNATVSHHVAC